MASSRYQREKFVGSTMRRHTSDSGDVMKSVNNRLTCTYVETRQSHVHTCVCMCVSVDALDVDSAATDGVVRHVSPRGGIAGGGSLIQYGRIVRVLS